MRKGFSLHKVAGTAVVLLALSSPVYAQSIAGPLVTQPGNGVTPNPANANCRYSATPDFASPAYPGPKANLPTPGSYYVPNPYYTNGYFNNGNFNNPYYNGGYSPGYQNNGYYSNSSPGKSTSFPPFSRY